MAKQYLGIDGGHAGALTVIEGDSVVEKIVMPIQKTSASRNEYNCFDIITFLNKYPDATVVFEKAHAMPQLGSVQAFNFGKGFGMMIGILTALKMKFHIVHAKTWQSEMFKDLPKQDTKAMSCMVAQRLFPSEDFTPTERSNKLHDGFTDSVLLAEFGRRRNL